MNLPMTLSYPSSRRDPSIVEDYHGTAIADPYRWLEESESEETQQWIADQNEVTFAYLQSLPDRESIAQRLTEIWNYEKYSIPFREGSRYFYFKNDGLQNQSILYTQDALTEPARVLLDPNVLSEDGTIALSGISISEDGQWMAYALSQSGSDWQEWRVKAVATGEDLPDRVQWSKFSGASWTKDGKGFFYSRYDEPGAAAALQGVNYYQKLYYHQLGTDQAEDELIYDRPDQKEWGFSGEVTEDGAYLIIAVWKGTSPQNLVFYRSLTEPSPVMPLIETFEASYSFLGNEGQRFWFLTDRDAPRKRVIAIDLSHPLQYTEVIPEQPETLQGVNLINDQWVAFYLHHACTQVKRFTLAGNLIAEISLPGIGSAAGFNGKRSDTDTFYSFTSFTVPPTIYHYDFTTEESTLFRQPSLPCSLDAYQTEQVFYPSKDGTLIPLFLTYSRHLPTPRPTYLYGYGGFNVSLTPSFSISNLIWLEKGGILAIPCLRGGGEYGEAWHQAGQRDRKQNVFDDFIAAAEWLIAQGWTTPTQLAIGGGSNGGLLVGACMVQRPELFGAALPSVGVMDMLRFHKFTIGWAWTEEYGSPDHPDDFPYLLDYSPLHQLKPGTAYPATLITTADHDDRVVPAHSFKFAAALQFAHRGEAPVLIRIETKAGHGAGKPTTKVIAEAADKWAFLGKVLHATNPPE